MIALEDCMAMCGLSQEEIDAIAEHEHIPEIAAAALADYLMHKQKGAAIVRDMIRDDIRHAIRVGDAPHARQLIHALNHFLKDHPEAAAL
jgi:hypothetical protein